MKKPIPTFIINLKKRTDRKKYIQKEFAGREEFDVNIVEAYESLGGAFGLWKTMQSIISTRVDSDEEYIIICEDDHKFTKEYTRDYLFRSIKSAADKGADVLFGGVSWFSSSMKIDEELFWVEEFTGTQFFVVFNKFFKSLGSAELLEENPADYKIGCLTSHKMFMFPFISVQKEFGYSDTTIMNNELGRVNSLFKSTQSCLKILDDVASYYSPANLQDSAEELTSYDGITLPTYVINLPERKDRLAHIKSEFEGRTEFEVTIVEACRHKTGAFGLWQTIRKIIRTAIKNKEDVIVICEDDHMFTDQYSKEYLLQNIIEAHSQRAKYLSGGTGKFGCAIPVTKNRYWVNHCLSAQFLVLYKSFFRQILAKPFDETVIADMLYSEMTSNKMVLYPFISVQKDFGYSDVTPLHNEDKALVANLFAESNQRLDQIQSAYLRYQGLHAKLPDPTFA